MGALLGEVVGNFKIIDLIGQGGMGEVYRAEHVLLGKRAAVKVLLPERCASNDIVDRFFNEAKAASLIDDPGIVDIFDFGTLPDGNAYIVMELLEGETLGERLRRDEPLSAARAVSIARHIAGTLGAVHAEGIIHRDLKPDNVFLVRDPALPRGERAKVLDFGIAKLVKAQPSDVSKTETGRLMGTPYYMSPEQCRGAGQVDHRTDIYSLGCVLYQMLTGRPPFVLEGAGEVLAAHIHVPPVSVRQHEPAVPIALERAVMTMLQKDPDRRFQSMEEVVDALNLAAPQFGGEDTPEPSLAGSDRFRPAVGTGRMPRAAVTGSGAHGRVRASSPLLTAATTLDSTAGQLAGPVPLPRPRRWPLVLAGAGALAVGALAVLALTGKLRGADEPPAVAGQVGAGAGDGAARGSSAPPSTAAGAASATPGSSGEAQPIVRELAPATSQRHGDKITLLIGSEPGGALVYREADGVRLGRTPIEVRVHRGAGEAAFILRRHGYHSERVALPVDSDRERIVVLRAKGAARRVATSAPPAAQSPSTAKGQPPASPQPEGGASTATDAPGKKPVDGAGKAAPEKAHSSTHVDSKDDALDPFHDGAR